MGGEQGRVMREEGAKEIHDARGGRGEVVEFKERIP